MAVYTITMIVYLVVILFVGLYVQKKLVKSKADFWNAGAKLGLLVSAGTVSATFISGGSLVGYPSSYFSSQGFAAPWHMLGTILGWIIIVNFFVHKIRRTNHTTLVDLFAERYGNGARIAAAIITLYAAGCYIVMNAAGVGAILSIVLGWNWHFSIILGFAIIIIYTTVSGYLGVVWTDVVQFFVLLLGTVLVAFFAVNAAGGFENIKETIINSDAFNWFYEYEGKNHAFPLQSRLRMTIQFGIANLAYAPYYVRILSAKDEIVARNSFIFSGVIAIFVWVCLLCAAAAGAVLLPNLEVVNDNYIAVLITTSLPVFAGAIMICGIVAAIMSSVDSFLHVAGVTVAKDLYQHRHPEATEKQLMTVTRVSIVAMGLICVLITLTNPASIFAIMVFLWGYIANGLAVPVICAFYWKRATHAGCVASMIGGTVVHTVWYLLGKPLGLNEFFPGLIAAVLLMIVVSLCTKPSDAAVIEKFHGEHMKLRYTGKMPEY